MPAVLNEAFRSPFDKVSGQGGKASPLTDSTADIRFQNQTGNPDAQDLNFAGLSGGSQLPYQMDYRLDSTPPATWGVSNQGYNTLPHPDQNQLYPSPLPQVEWTQPQKHYSHNCDRLIGEIMSCRVCRQKLQRLLNAWDEDHPENQEAILNKNQQGGAQLPFPLGDLSPNLITNIIIGITIIFLLDRILKLRLVSG